MSYTSSRAQTSQGTILEINSAGGTGGAGGSGSPQTWVTVNEAVDLKFSNKLMFDDTTNTQSAAKEFLATLPDPGKLSGTLNRVSNDPGQAMVQASFAATPPLTSLFRVQFPINVAAGQSVIGDEWTFLAYVEQISPDIKADKKISNTFSLQITGAITVAEGS